MSDQPVLFSRAAATCRLTLNREDKCHAINEEMIESLDHYLNEIENDTTLRLVELTATGDKFFCAGGDIKSWSAYSPLDMGRKWIKRGNEVFNRLRNLPQLTVANLNGHTIGGGIELALCCDIRIARPSAKFSNPEVMLGMVPGWMGIERVLNQVGPVVGRQMLMLGKRLTAHEAQAANLIDEVVEKEQVESWMANQLAQLEKCGPVALAHIKQLILALENKHADYSHQLLAGLMSATQDCQQATRAFAEKSSVSSTINKEIVCVRYQPPRHWRRKFRTAQPLPLAVTAAAWWKLTIFWQPLKLVSCKPDTRAI